MRTLQLNADMGERAFADPNDLAMLPYIDAMNIAVGGHAGDLATARDLARRALDLGISVNLHPSYPDRVGFGRRILPMGWAELRTSLDQQRELLPEVVSCKLHGALYNQVLSDEDLAHHVLAWMRSTNLSSVVTMPGGCLARFADAYDIEIIAEGFADRGYTLEQGRLALEPRSSALALVQTVEAVHQRISDLLAGQVQLTDGSLCELHVDTVCIHGDGMHALAFAQAARAALP